MSRLLCLTELLRHEQIREGTGDRIQDSPPTPGTADITPRVMDAGYRLVEPPYGIEP
jgi:hypothetical protein